MPLTDLPEESVDLAEEEIPLADASQTESQPSQDVLVADVPQTGDNLTVWLTIAGGSALTLFSLNLGKKKAQ